MIINELYKIITRKEIIISIMIFCMLNIFYVHHTAVNTNENVKIVRELYKQLSNMDYNDKVEYLENKIDEESMNRNDVAIYTNVLNYTNNIENYSDYVLGITEAKESVFDAIMFGDTDSFATKNKRDVEIEYKNKNMHEVKPVFGNYEGVVRGVKFGVHDVFLMIIVLVISLGLIIQEKKSKMMDLFRPSRNGRGGLYISKCISLVITVIGITLVVNIINIVINILDFGCDNLWVPIQSVNTFMESTLRMNILEYIVFYLLLKSLGMVLWALVTMLICVIAKNEMQVYICSVLILGVEYVLYNLIDGRSSICMAKYLNVFSFIDTYSVSKGYYNFNFFERPIQLLHFTIISILILSVIIILIGYLCFKSPTAIGYASRKRMLKHKKERCYSLTTNESYKMFIKNRFALILIGVLVFQIYTYNSYEFYKTQVESLELSYVLKLDGAINENNIQFIEEEEKRFDKMYKDLIQAQDDYSIGLIDERTMEARQIEYNMNENARKAFENIKNKKLYLEKLKKEKNIDGWFVFEKGYMEALYHNQKAQEAFEGIMLLFLLIMGILPVFASDNEIDMDKVILPTKNGRKKVFIVRTGLMITSSIIAAAVVYIPRYFFVLKASGMNMSNAPIQSITEYMNFPVEISILQYVMGVFCVQAMMSIVVSLLIMGISVRIRSLLKGQTSLLFVLLIPMFLVYFGYHIFENILFVPGMILNNTLRELDINKTMGVVLFCIISQVVFVKSYMKYCRE